MLVNTVNPAAAARGAEGGDAGRQSHQSSDAAWRSKQLRGVAGSHPVEGKEPVGRPPVVEFTRVSLCCSVSLMEGSILPIVDLH